jgi:hypothetical protein
MKPLIFKNLYHCAGPLAWLVDETVEISCNNTWFLLGNCGMTAAMVSMINYSNISGFM